MASPPSPPQSRERRLPRGVVDMLGLLLVLAALVGLFGTTSKNFLTARTARNVAGQIPDLTVVAAGMTLVLVGGGIDLSVGSVAALGAAVFAVAMTDWHWPVAAAAPLAPLVGLVCGLANGGITVAARVPSFIVTLGMLEVARGLCYLLTNSQTRYLGPAAAGLAEPMPGVGLPWTFALALAVAAAGQFVLVRTVFGRHLVAVGANEAAVLFSGIDPRPVRLAAFGLSGALAGLAGLFATARLQTADPNAGTGLELSAIAAVVIGGTSLSGGRGSVLGALLGVLIMAVLQTGLAQAGVSEPMKRVVTGAVIVAAVLLDALRTRRGRFRPAAS